MEINGLMQMLRVTITIRVFELETICSGRLKFSIHNLTYCMLSAPKAASVIEINVIFLDLNLPDISGIELCSQIRYIWSNACIIAIKGFN